MTEISSREALLDLNRFCHCLCNGPSCPQVIIYWIFDSLPLLAYSYLTEMETNKPTPFNIIPTTFTWQNKELGIELKTNDTSYF